MYISEVAAFGWNRVVRIANGQAELLITAEVGPRILGYRLLTGDNVLRTFPEQMGTQGEPGYQVRGGHRLWISPEIEITYAPDNGPVEITTQAQGDAVLFVNPATDRCPVRKELTVAL